MFFILSKTLFYILMPLVWITMALAFAFLTQNQTKRKKAVGIALLMVLLFGNQFLVNEVYLWWESPPVPLASIKDYDYAIVLTGVTNTERRDITDRVYFNKGADRVLHTVQLYKSGKVKKVIISGGSGSLTGKKVKEAQQLQKVFLECGVPAGDILVEPESRNTHENALYTKRLIDSLHLKGKFLLITSAFHMRRSEGCFKKAGMQFDIYPVDIYTIDRKFTPSSLIIPSETALARWATFIHELTGYVVYKLLGYC